MSDRPLLLGHRGARSTRSIPENSLASFDLALQHGCDGFEFDVRLTGDGHAVICHDPEVNGVRVSGARLGDLGLIARLEEVLERYSTRAFLDIELKVAGLEKRVVDALRNCPPQRGFVVSSFLGDVVNGVHGADDTLPLGLISDRRSDFAQWRGLPISFVIPHFSLVTRELVQEVHSAGKKLLVWTVNDPAAMVRIAEWGIDGVISDDTQLLVRTLG